MRSSLPNYRRIEILKQKLGARGGWNVAAATPPSGLPNRITIKQTILAPNAIMQKRLDKSDRVSRSVVPTIKT